MLWTILFWIWLPVFVFALGVAITANGQARPARLEAAGWLQITLIAAFVWPFTALLLVGIVAGHRIVTAVNSAVED